MNKITLNHAIGPTWIYMYDKLPSTPPIIRQLACYDCELFIC